MKLNEIQDLIKFVAKSGVSEVELETKDVKIIIRTPASKNREQIYVQTSSPQVLPVQAMQTQEVFKSPEVKTPEVKVNAEDNNANYITVKAPMVGTFYRSSAPDKPLFVNVGDDIIPGKVTCIIEAMKLFNEIESEIKGKIVKVLVNDASPVEYDQALFLVDPS